MYFQGITSTQGQNGNWEGPGKTSDTFHVVSSCYKEKIQTIEEVGVNEPAGQSPKFIHGTTAGHNMEQVVPCCNQGWDVTKMDEALHNDD